MDELKQSAKGENITQNSITLQNYQTGINREEVIDLIKLYCPNRESLINIVHEVINDISQERQQMPHKRIFIPVIQQLSYSNEEGILKEAYKNLLKASMDIERSSIIHP